MKTLKPTIFHRLIKSLYSVSGIVHMDYFCFCCFVGAISHSSCMFFILDYFFLKWIDLRRKNGYQIRAWSSRRLDRGFYYAQETFPNQLQLKPLRQPSQDCVLSAVNFITAHSQALMKLTWIPRHLFSFPYRCKSENSTSVYGRQKFVSSIQLDADDNTFVVVHRNFIGENNP